MCSVLPRSILNWRCNIAVKPFLSRLHVPSFPNHRLFGGRVPIVA